MFEDGAKEILQGCDQCGSRLFFYIKKDRVKELKELHNNLNEEEKEQIEKDIVDLIGEERLKDNSVVLDIEAIRIPKPGEYEIDLVRLFKGEPVVYKVEEGKYFIDISRSFKNILDKRKHPSK
jgi:predicted  nucleic acid-binding Zn-ribbon protein